MAALPKRYDSRGRPLDVDASKSDDDIASAQTTSKMSSTAGAGLGKKGKSAPNAPKQEPGESASSYAARYRRYRERLTANDQAEALEKKK